MFPLQAYWLDIRINVCMYVKRQDRAYNDDYFISEAGQSMLQGGSSTGTAGSTAVETVGVTRKRASTSQGQHSSFLSLLVRCQAQPFLDSGVRLCSRAKVLAKYSFIV